MNSFIECGAPQTKRKAANTCEQVDLRVAEEVFVRNDFDVSFIDNPFREQAFVHAFAQHRRAVGVVLVVVMRHSPSPLKR